MIIDFWKIIFLLFQFKSNIRVEVKDFIYIKEMYLSGFLVLDLIKLLRLLYDWGSFNSVKGGKRIKILISISFITWAIFSVYWTKDLIKNYCLKAKFRQYFKKKMDERRKKLIKILNSFIFLFFRKQYPYRYCGKWVFLPWNDSSNIYIISCLIFTFKNFITFVATFCIAFSWNRICNNMWRQ